MEACKLHSYYNVPLRATLLIAHNPVSFSSKGLHTQRMKLFSKLATSIKLLS